MFTIEITRKKRLETLLEMANFFDKLTEFVDLMQSLGCDVKVEIQATAYEAKAKPESEAGE